MRGHGNRDVRHPSPNAKPCDPRSGQGHTAIETKQARGALEAPRKFRNGMDVVRH